MNAMKRFLQWAGVMIGTMILTGALSGSAASVTVFVGNTNLTGNAADVFVPPITNINVGDSVVWVWEGTLHSTTSGTNGVTGDDNGVPSGLWDSTLVGRPFSFTNVFNSAGSFLYFCENHFTIGMTGAVNVAAAALPPAVSITNPVNNATFSAPASFTLTATASSSSGTVSFTRSI